MTECKNTPTPFEEPKIKVKQKKKKKKKNDKTADEDVLNVMVFSLKESSTCLVVHPSWNYHSYQPVSFFSRISFFSGRTRCFTCQQTFGITSDASAVQCLGCGVYAHRSCAFRGPIHHKEKQHDRQPNLFCKIHYPMVKSLLHQHQPQQQQKNSTDGSNFCATTHLNDKGAEHSPDDPCSTVPSIPCATKAKHDAEITNSFTLSNGSVTVSHLSKDPLKITTNNNILEVKKFDTSDNLFEIFDVTTLASNIDSSTYLGMKVESANSEARSMASVEKETEISIIDVQATASCSITEVKGVNNSTHSPHLMDGARIKEDSFTQNSNIEVELQGYGSNHTILNSTRIASAIESLSNYCYSTTKATISGASLTGSVVGGVAGLAFAGPAGAFIGSKLGQAACVLTVLYQGRKVMLIGAGLLAAGMTISTASTKAFEQHHDGKKYHLLTLDEEAIDVNKPECSSDSSISSTIVLVRPNVIIDHSSWNEVISNAKNSFSKISIKKIDGIRADSDILEATELDTEEKVLLLVSRSLNDKFSLPGFMFRCLIEEHRKRVEQRRNSPLGYRSGENIANDADSSNVSSADDPASFFMHSRSSRQDAHAIIFYITTSFLEVRPEVRSCQRFMDIAKDSVEIVVLSELYQPIFEEIMAEVSLKDVSLAAKVKEFESSDSYNLLPMNYSNDAIETLQNIANFHSPIQKLDIFVIFLELISVTYSANAEKTSRDGCSSMINADSLLTSVCRHIILAKVDNLNAEIGFVEEFAKDEDLLRGKSGYALVTMQASLHVLNECSKFDSFFAE